MGDGRCKASLVCMLAGADFIKTSTGKEKVNANLPTSLAMVRMIREFHDETGIEIGYKPAGGISTAKDVLNYQFLLSGIAPTTFGNYLSAASTGGVGVNGGNAAINVLARQAAAHHHAREAILFRDGFLTQWVRSCLTTWPVAFVSVTLLAPQVRKLVALITEPG